MSVDLDRVQRIVIDARKILERNKNRNESWIAAMHIRDLPETKAAGLHKLAWLLASEEYGCCYNDVSGLLELFQKWIDDNKLAGGKQ